MTQVYYSEENFERLRRAQELGTRKNATLLQIGLAYVLHQAFPVVALAGPTTAVNLNGVRPQKDQTGVLERKRWGRPLDWLAELERLSQ